MPTRSKKQVQKSWQDQLHELIFEADTVTGKSFDIILLIAIVASVIAVCWESLPNLDPTTKNVLYIVEWIFTIFFTIEYVTRMIAVHKPMKYATSFYGIIDLLSIIPTYLSLFIVGTNSLLVLRALRLMRLFRIFKMVPFLDQGNIIVSSIRSSIPKLTVFVSFIMIVVCISGAVMYLVEGHHGNESFDSIPRGIYWSIVTITTVGFGDIVPKTALGQFLSALLMIMGYAVIAVPTGIVSAEIAKGGSSNDEPHEYTTQACRYCSLEGHDPDAVHCKHCGEVLNVEDEPTSE